MVSSIDIVTVKLPQEFRAFAARVADERGQSITGNSGRRDRVRARSLVDVKHDIIVGTLGELVSAKWVGPEAFRDVGRRLCDRTKTHDNGTDFALGESLEFDSKTAQSNGISPEGALWSEFDLQVSCAIKPETVYNAVFLDADGKRAHLIGWIYGHELKGDWDGHCPWSQLRPMRELRDIIDGLKE